jgi:hypothetical protein
MLRKAKSTMLELREVENVKPILFGYQTVRVSTPAGAVFRGREALADFAHREGFALGEVFVERDVDRPCSALTALICAARRSNVMAVAVPTTADLGKLPRVRWLMQHRLEREAGVRVLVVQS